MKLSAKAFSVGSPGVDILMMAPTLNSCSTYTLLQYCLPRSWWINPIGHLDLESLDQIRIHLRAMLRIGRMHSASFPTTGQLGLSHHSPDPLWLTFHPARASALVTRR